MGQGVSLPIGCHHFQVDRAFRKTHRQVHETLREGTGEKWQRQGHPAARALIVGLHLCQAERVPHLEAELVQASRGRDAGGHPVFQDDCPLEVGWCLIQLGAVEGHGRQGMPPLSGHEIGIVRDFEEVGARREG